MLENLKEEVIRVSLEAQRDGLCKHKSGNFSIRDKKTGFICITPTGVDREKLKVDDISVLDLNCKLVEGLKPSSESMVHYEIYKNCPHVYGIVHTHSKMATSFAVVNKPIPAILYEAATFKLENGKIPVAPYGRPGTLELAMSVTEVAKKVDVLLMEKHGVLTHGETLEDAYLKAQYVEEIAQVYFNALMINHNEDVEPLPLAELEGWKYPEQLIK